MSNVGNATYKRILSAVVALPVYVYTVLTDQFQAIPILVASLVISAVTLHEFYRITDKGEEGKPFYTVGLITSAVINIIMYLFAYGDKFGYNKYIAQYDARIIIGLIAFFLSIILVLQIVQRPIKGGIYSLGVTVFGVIYIVFAFSHIILMKSLSNGIYYIIIIHVVVMLNDTGAYFGGLLFGKHKANIKVSPNKTWEGYFSGLVLGIITLVIANKLFEVFWNKSIFTTPEVIIVGFVLCVLGCLGDLVESAIKRDGLIKDSGSIIPGHGGMWDTFDALIFTLPIFYYYLVLKGIPC